MISDMHLWNYFYLQFPQNHINFSLRPMYHQVMKTDFSHTINADTFVADQNFEKLQIKLSCRNLVLHSEPNIIVSPYAVIQLITDNRPKRKVLRTDSIQKNPNPDYVETIIIDYLFETKQIILVSVYDDRHLQPVLIGKGSTTASKIFGAPCHGVFTTLFNAEKKEVGKAIFMCKKLEKIFNDQITMQLEAKNLPNIKILGIFGSTNPFFRIFRKRKYQDLLIYQSQIIKGTCNPTFKTFTISERRLCKNQETQPFLIKFYDFSQLDKSNKYLGYCELKITQINCDKSYNIVNKGKDEANGSFTISKFKRFQKFDFGDYISAGLQLSLMVCFDYSNEQMIQPNLSIANILENIGSKITDYCPNRQINAFGFGIKIQKKEFNSNGKLQKYLCIAKQLEMPQINSIESLVDAYKSCFFKIKDQPRAKKQKTVDMVNKAIQTAASLQISENRYLVVLLFLEEQMQFSTELIKSLQICQSLPISVIAITTGNLNDQNCSDFQNSQQIFEQRKFLTTLQTKGKDIKNIPKQALQRLPQQIQQYFILKGLKPHDIQTDEFIGSQFFQMTRDIPKINSQLPIKRDIQNMKEYHKQARFSFTATMQNKFGDLESKIIKI